MALGTRYTPSHPPGDSIAYALDLSPILPRGVGLTSASLTIVRNTNPTAPAPEWNQQPCQIRGRRVYCQIEGGAAGMDYQLRWAFGDNQGQAWQRTVLLACAPTA
jgi:hypothetical protein